ncbi:hypothetical protein AB1Y20_003845 [Prymnesium parvum]|uniref:PPM-type phosphatase domain-containing protein n=1 Tax=Prymnesium parvum TaxID=97485 RepID=A0AB34J5V9_PRYPA
MRDDTALAALFARLGLAPSASLEEVHSAYKARLREYVSQGKAVDELKEAHRVLADSSLRDAYRIPAPAQPLALGVTEYGHGARDEAGEAPRDANGRPAYGFAGFQGHRLAMEDALVLGAPCASGAHLFAVCDGHGGRRAADFLTAELPAVIGGLPLAESLALHLPAAAEKAYAELDRKLLRVSAEEGWHDGSTALAVVVSRRRLQVLQVGDCQAVLCGAFGVEELCVQHRPEEPSEAARLAALGEQVVNGRIHSLSVSRAFGDLDSKALGPGVVASPQVVTRELDPTDEMLILGCDGLWDAMTGQDAWTLVQRAGHKTKSKWELEAAARALATAAIDRGSTDNVSVILLLLK